MSETPSAGPGGRIDGRMLPCICNGSLRVTDTGIGMKCTIVARLFALGCATTVPGQGVGLGLSMVHGAVIQTAGVVSVDSAPGRGTTVRLYLPVNEEATTGFDVVVDRAIPS